MKTMLGFMGAVMRLPMPWPLWLLVLVTVNMVAPLFFLGSVEAVAVLIVFGASAMIMMVLYAKYGFVRLLGVGHVAWLGLVPWLAFRLSENAVGSSLWLFIAAVIAADALSLIFDIADVVRYWRGDRAPQV